MEAIMKTENSNSNSNSNGTKLAYKSDDQLKTEVLFRLRHALKWNRLVPTDQIHTKVSDGWVTLEGNIEHHYQKVDAERVVRDIAGVSGVTNLIDITSPVDPEKVKLLIKEHLKLHGDHEANPIEVKIEEGEVTLSGAVFSWNEKMAILNIVSHIPGITAIDDHLIPE
jgi:osmotically-inducible protein OsmY